MKKSTDFFRGCIIGGAIGDALGLTVEFLPLPEIYDRFGEGGVTDLVTGTNGTALISDDTQMTIFTAEGLLRAIVREREKGISDIPSVVHNAYLRWLSTQGAQICVDDRDGWIIKLPQLHKRRAPGNTCLSALASGLKGSLRKPVNDSKGCGGVMRSAPFGLLYDRDKAFAMGVECAALTHGHPNGYLPAGVLAYLISSMIEGMELEEALASSLRELSFYHKHIETTKIVVKALTLAKGDKNPQQCIKELGEGWTGEEALAISIYCSLKFNDFKQALVAAVNHDGDSDSTGAITGNIMGALLGIDAVPREWVKILELRDELTTLADDLLIGYQDTDAWRNKYPGW